MQAFNPGAVFPVKGNWKEVEPEEADEAINSGGAFVIEGIVEGNELYAPETAWAYKEIANGTLIIFEESESIHTEMLLSAPFEALTPLILEDTTLYLGPGGPAYRFFLPG